MLRLTSRFSELCREQCGEWTPVRRSSAVREVLQRPLLCSSNALQLSLEDAVLTLCRFLQSIGLWEGGTRVSQMQANVCAACCGRGRLAETGQVEQRLLISELMQVHNGSTSARDHFPQLLRAWRATVASQTGAFLQVRPLQARRILKQTFSGWYSEWIRSTVRGDVAKIAAVLSVCRNQGVFHCWARAAALGRASRKSKVLQKHQVGQMHGRHRPLAVKWRSVALEASWAVWCGHCARRRNAKQCLQDRAHAIELITLQRLQRGACRVLIIWKRTVTVRATVRQVLHQLQMSLLHRNLSRVFSSWIVSAARQQGMRLGKSRVRQANVEILRCATRSWREEVHRSLRRSMVRKVTHPSRCQRVLPPWAADPRHHNLSSFGSAAQQIRQHTFVAWVLHWRLGNFVVSTRKSWLVSLMRSWRWLSLSKLLTVSHVRCAVGRSLHTWRHSSRSRRKTFLLRLQRSQRLAVESWLLWVRVVTDQRAAEFLVHARACKQMTAMLHAWVFFARRSRVVQALYTCHHCVVLRGVLCRWCAVVQQHRKAVQCSTRVTSVRLRRHLRLWRLHRAVAVQSMCVSIPCVQQCFLAWQCFAHHMCATKAVAQTCIRAWLGVLGAQRSFVSRMRRFRLSCDQSTVFAAEVVARFLCALLLAWRQGVVRSVAWRHRRADGFIAARVGPLRSAFRCFRLACKSSHGVSGVKRRHLAITRREARKRETLVRHAWALWQRAMRSPAGVRNACFAQAKSPLEVRFARRVAGASARVPLV